MKLGEGYKKTEFGLIPADWNVSTVGSEFSVQLGKMLDAEKNVGLQKPYLGNRSVQWDKIDLSDLQTMAMTRADLEKFRLRTGDLLVCEGGEVGRAAIWNSPIEECYYQKALHRLRPLRGYEPVLMVAVLRLWAERGLLSDYVTQTSIAHLPLEKFVTLPIPRPPNVEQRAIANVLSDVDALIAGLERLIAKKCDIKQAAMQQLLTGQTRLSGFSGAWSLGVFGDAVSSLDAGVSVNSTDGAPETGVPCVLKTSALSGGLFLPHEAKVIEARDINRARIRPKRDTILISRMNTPMLVGEVAYVPQDFDTLFLPDRVWMAEFNSGKSVCVRWLTYVLSSRTYRSQLRDLATGTSSSMKNISKDALLSLPILFPSFEEQNAIAAVFSDIDADLFVLESRVSKTRALKQGLMQELLTGRTRLGSFGRESESSKSDT